MITTQSEVLFHAGDKAHNVFLIHSGKVCILAPREVQVHQDGSRVVQHKLPEVRGVSRIACFMERHTSSCQQVELEIVPSLGLVGELAILQRKQHYLHTAVAIGPTHVFVCTSHVFQRLFGRYSKKQVRCRDCNFVKHA